MKQLAVIQHSSAEYLGMLEDHLEGRGTRFQYFRPFTSDGKLPTRETLHDGLVLLSGGPWGSAGTNDVPTLQAEIALARMALDNSVPIVGIGLGAQILALAAGGSVQSTPLRMEVAAARSESDAGLNGLMPDTFPVVQYGRDTPVLPADARVLARLPDDEAAVWQLADRRAFGFSSHPGFKLGMVEDLIMEFDDAPANVHDGLAQFREVQVALADALVPLMAGLVNECDWM